MLPRNNLKKKKKKKHQNKSFRCSQTASQDLNLIVENFLTLDFKPQTAKVPNTLSFPNSNLNTKESEIS